MKIVVDTSVLAHLLAPDVPAPIDPATGLPVQYCQERIEGLLASLDKAGAQLVIPTPVLSELLIKALGREADVLAVLANSRSVVIQPFDEMAALENAQLRRTKFSKSGATKKEVSFDLQILAIARTVGAEKILTDDQNLRKRAVSAGMEVIGIAEIPLDDSQRQISMFLDSDAGGDVEDADLSDGEVTSPDGSNDLLEQVGDPPSVSLRD